MTATPSDTIDARMLAFRTLDARVPLVLLPVRLELRWYAGDDPAHVELRVRVFPDAIAMRRDRAGLSTLEIAVGQAYWRERSTDAAGAWARLVSTMGAARALHVARAVTPSEPSPGTLVFPALAPDDDPTGPARLELLPDRWFVRGVGAAGTVFDAFGERVAAGIEVDPSSRWLNDFAEAKALGMALAIPMTWPDARALETVIAFGVREALGAEAGAAALASLLDAHAADEGLAFVPVGAEVKGTPEDAAATLAALQAGGAGALPADANGARLARALGVPVATFAFVPRAAAAWDLGAAAVNTALWPVTWGHYLEQLMHPLFAHADVEAGRTDFIRFVRARGPLPALSAGAQPYGVLPIVSLADWRPFGDGDSPRRVSALARLAESWRALDPPRVGGGGDGVGDLDDVLAMGPVSRRFWARRMIGRATAAAERSDWDLVPDLDGILDALRDALLLGPLAALGLAGRPLLADRVFDDDALRIRLPIAWAGGDPSQPLPQNYITALGSATVEALREDAITGASPRSLLYLLLRHALLLAYAKGGDVRPPTGGAIGGAVTAAMAVAASAAAERLDDAAAPWTRVNRGHAAASAVGLLDPRPERGAEVGQIKRSLGVLAPLPVAELERLCGETLDLASHRLDAWITAVATRRLAALRDEMPSGCHVGGFGLVTAAPPPAPELLARDGGPPVRVPSNAGFLHAPSLAHAKTAAVLRAGFLSHRGQGAGSPLAVDLSSDRVRGARWLLDSSAAGQPFRALLGYRITRLLGEEGRWDDIETWRGLHPLTVTVDGDPAGAKEIDGLAVFEALRARPAPLPAAEQQLFDMLLELIDATSDLLVAEAVHQSVQARPARARVALEALETFERPVTDPGVIATPAAEVRSGLRVALSLPDATAGWASGAGCPRAVAEPRLEGWVAAMLGDPARLRLLVRTDAVEREVSLSELGLCALDVVWLAGTDESEPALFALVRAWVGAPESATAVVPNQALDEALLVARAVSRLLGSARALGPADLVDGELAPAAEAVAPSPSLAARAVAVDQALAALGATVEARESGTWLRAAALLGTAVPDTADAAAALAARLGARRKAGAEAPDPRARMAALVGADLPIIDPLAWPSPPPLAAADLPDGTALAWIHDLGRVRAALEPLDELMLVAADMPVAAFRLGRAQRLLAVGAAPGATVAGLLLDQLTESQGAPVLTTGAAFHYDAPDAAPPQTLLVAVPGDVAAGWDHGRLANTVGALLALAKLRLLTPDAIASHFLPATCVAENLASQGISMPLSESLVRPALRED